MPNNKKYYDEKALRMAQEYIDMRWSTRFKMFTPPDGTEIDIYSGGEWYKFEVVNKFGHLSPRSV